VLLEVWISFKSLSPMTDFTKFVQHMALRVYELTRFYCISDSQGKFSNSLPDIASKESPIDWAYSKTILCKNLYPEDLVHLWVRASRCLKMLEMNLYEKKRIETQTGYFLMKILQILFYFLTKF
jgi:hypothetical protein